MVSSDGQDHFRMRSKILLESIASDGLESNIAQKLINARLLSTDFNDEEDGSTIELAHEAIILSWSRLKNWLEDDLDFIRWIQLVKPMAERWEIANDKSELLLSGRLLSEAEALLSERRTDIERVVNQYLVASMEANEQKKQIRASSKLDVILNAEPSRLIEKIEDARSTGYLSPTFLEQKFAEAENDANIWKLRLAALTEGGDHLAAVLKKLDNCLHDELFSICFFLQKNSTDSLGKLCLQLKNEEMNDEIFIRRAAALAYVSQDTNRLSNYSKRCSSILSKENPLLVREFIQVFKPVRSVLYDHLIEIVSSPRETMPVRDTAALAILELFDKDVEKLAPLLCEQPLAQAGLRER